MTDGRGTAAWQVQQRRWALVVSWERDGLVLASPRDATNGPLADATPHAQTLAA